MQEGLYSVVMMKILVRAFSNYAEDDEDEQATLGLALVSLDDSIITHTVTFKCIGCTKEYQYQESLCLVHHFLHVFTFSGFCVSLIYFTMVISGWI